jgi:polyhydroxyalkanoate synthesis repressor PhaR
MALIKRYSNRKLYDTEARQYITLDEIGEMIQQGQEIKVIDHERGSDITALTLAQIILEQEKKIGGMLPEAILFRLVRFGGTQVNYLRGAVHAFLEPVQYVEDEIRRRLEDLTQDGALSEKDAKSLGERLLDKRFRQVEPRGYNPDSVENKEQELLSSILKQLESHVEKMEKELEELLKTKQAKP